MIRIHLSGFNELDFVIYFIGFFFHSFLVDITVEKRNKPFWRSRGEKRRCLRIKPAKGVEKCARIRASLPLLKVLLKRVLLSSSQSRIIAESRDRRKEMIGKRWEKTYEASSSTLFEILCQCVSTVLTLSEVPSNYQPSQLFSYPSGKSLDDLYRQTSFLVQIIFRYYKYVWINIRWSSVRDLHEIEDLKKDFFSMSLSLDIQ